jgi:hypothetical protein
VNNLLQSIVADIERVRPYVRQGMIARGITEVGGFDEYSDDILAELVTKVPTMLAAVSLHSAAGNVEAAREAVEAALDALQEIEPNSLYAIDPYKDIYRLLSRRHYADQASADAQAAYAGIDESRRAARQLADLLGVRIADVAESGPPKSNAKPTSPPPPTPAANARRARKAHPSI